MTISLSLKSIQYDIRNFEDCLNNLKTCNSFLSKYIGKSFFEKDELEKDQLGASMAFRDIFWFITRNTLNSCKTTYQIAQPIIDSDSNEELKQSLALLCTKINECEAVMNVFKTGCVELLKGFSEPLLKIDSEYETKSMIGMGDDLGECHCCLNMGRNSRHAFTKSLAEKIQEHFPEKKEITVVSTGPGASFHELTIHAYLADLGYKIQWILVDPILCEISRTVPRFKMIADWITPDTSVERVCKKADEFFNSPIPQADVFLFIDLWSEVNSQIDFFGSKMNHPCLFATHTKAYPPAFVKYPIIK